jgi:hypothetical protein
LIPIAAAAPAPAASVYWSDLLGIHRANLDGTDREDLLDNRAVGLQLDIDAGKMYWTDGLTDTVFRADLDGGNVEPLAVDKSGFLVNIALDVTNERVYWTNPAGDTVLRTGFGGGDVQPVVSPDPLTNRPYGLAIDSHHEKLYWSETGDFGGGPILRSNLDGSQREPFVPIQTGSPYFMALDASAGWLYWTAVGNDVGAGAGFFRARLDGSGIEPLIDDQSGDSLALDLVERKMLWTTDTALHRSNLDGSAIETLFETPGSRARAVAIDTTLPGDADGDRLVDLDDFGILKANFGPGAAAAVPEPQAAILALVGAACALATLRLLRHARAQPNRASR